ncbi:hypothetical protein D3C76_1056320 [compost metagenome]
MNHTQMQPLSSKELNYISDSIANEETLIKLCTAAASVCSNAQIGQELSEQIQCHEKHMQTLISCLQQHQTLASSTTH